MNRGAVIEQNRMIGFKHSARRFVWSFDLLVGPAAPTRRAADCKRLSMSFHRARRHAFWSGSGRCARRNRRPRCGRAAAAGGHSTAGASNNALQPTRATEPFG